MTRWIPAPQSDNQPHGNAVLGVSLNPGEQVQWAYTLLPDGRKVITGYDIVAAKLQANLRNKVAGTARKKGQR
jgi:hypothetical protein